MRLNPLHAAALALQASRAAATVIQWGTCKDDFHSPSRVDCGRLFVPLDYTEPDGETLSLKLLRVPADKEPVKGSILLNFGGPGATGRDSLAGTSRDLLMYVVLRGDDLQTRDVR